MAPRKMIPAATAAGLLALGGVAVFVSQIPLEEYGLNLVILGAIALVEFGAGFAIGHSEGWAAHHRALRGLRAQAKRVKRHAHGSAGARGGNGR